MMIGGVRFDQSILMYMYENVTIKSITFYH